jgi:hypothetical protein
MSTAHLCSRWNISLCYSPVGTTHPWRVSVSQMPQCHKLGPTAAAYQRIAVPETHRRAKDALQCQRRSGRRNAAFAPQSTEPVRACGTTFTLKSEHISPPPYIPLLSLSLSLSLSLCVCVCVCVSLSSPSLPPSLQLHECYADNVAHHHAQHRTHCHLRTCSTVLVNNAFH